MREKREKREKREYPTDGMDGGPFRFNFQVDGVKDAEEGEGEGEGKGRGSAGERDKKTDKVEAEELELAPLVQDNELEQDSRNSDCYAQERLSETISLWKVHFEFSISRDSNSELTDIHSFIHSSFDSRL